MAKAKAKPDVHYDGEKFTIKGVNKKGESVVKSDLSQREDAAVYLSTDMQMKEPEANEAVKVAWNRFHNQQKGPKRKQSPCRRESFKDRRGGSIEHRSPHR